MAMPSMAPQTTSTTVDCVSGSSGFSSEQINIEDLSQISCESSPESCVQQGYKPVSFRSRQKGTHLSTSFQPSALGFATFGAPLEACESIDRIEH